MPSVEESADESKSAAPADIAGIDVRATDGLLFRALSVGLGGFTLWSAGPGLTTDHVRLSVYLGVTWCLVLLWRDARGTLRATAPGVLALGLAAATVAGFAWIAFNAAMLFGTGVGGQIALIALAVGMIACFRVSEASNYMLAGIGLFALWYYQTNYLDIVNRAGAWTETDVFIAASVSILVLEIARRGMGLAIPFIALGAVGYAYFGPYMPYDIAHRGVGLDRIANYTFYSQEGIFGIMTGVMANYVLVFILLGAFMNRSGMGQFFIEFPMALAGRSAGGPAKVAVFASGVFGSISGSSLANIVSTGTFTIPLMKRVGFRPAVAGAVENSASLGGQLLPPVMGAGVFVMAEITGIPYVEIITVALAPALLYFASIIMIVHFEARRNGIGGVPEHEMLRARDVFRRGWFHIVPFGILIGFLIAGYSPDRCALMAIVTIIGINWARHVWARLSGGSAPEELMDHNGIIGALTDGMRNALLVGSIAAAVGIIVGMIALTGFGLKMGVIMVNAFDGMLFPTLVLIALTSLILGMALPITAAYLVLVVIAAPALESLGVPLIAAHLIVFWLSQDSNITPPVCLGAFVAASIAGAKPWPTAWLSFRFAKLLYVMPLLFAYSPILFTETTEAALWTIFTASLGTLAFAAWTMGYLVRATGIWGGLVLALCAVGLFMPFDLVVTGGVTGLTLNLLGGCVLIGFAAFQWVGTRRIVEKEGKV